ncbi:MAG: PQQ-binding-like beta-propeller repeat protein [Gemmataceae bacterium]|nr:PQQ-binding-like beta-propeller repeat protein [Gemmataceae bacterium]
MKIARCVVVLSFVAAPVWGQAPSLDDLAAYESILRQHHLPASGPDLLRYFQERTLNKEQIAQLAAKVDQLNDPAYAVRVKAAAELIKAGSLAKPFLVELVRRPNVDLEALRRAEQCLKQITEGGEARLAVATAHLIGKHKPQGAAAALLAYVPFVVDEQVEEALQTTLNALAVKNGKPEPSLVRALSDPSERKRAAAAEALVRGAGLKHKALVEPLLKEESPHMRLQITRALVEAKDKTAVPELIRVLGDLPTQDAWEAEELLHRIAGDSAPSIYADAKTPPAKVRQAWLNWWSKHESFVDLSKLDETPGMLGYTLVTQMTAGPGQNGRVMELRPNKEVHWKIEGIRYPLDAQVVGKDRVLVVEYLNSKITERDFKGDVHWEKQVSLPVAAQRLPNGHTFVVTRRSLLVLDREGNQVFQHQAGVGNINAGHRLRDGTMAYVNTMGLLKIIDPQGNDIKSFQVGQVYATGGNIDPLPGGGFLVPLYRENRIVEFDRNGQIKWELKVNYPTSATKLPNGNVLVVSLTNQRVVELNRAGEEVWSFNADGRLWKARRR